jgi:hypothetical protein
VSVHNPLDVATVAWSGLAGMKGLYALYGLTAFRDHPAPHLVRPARRHRTLRTPPG